jgi:hypothetical protein
MPLDEYDCPTCPPEASITQTIQEHQQGASGPGCGPRGPGGAARDPLPEDLAEELSGAGAARQPERPRSPSRISWETRSL